MTADDQPRPEFGPRGYLPDRAANRARKIILRAPLGLQWIVAAVLAGVVVLVAGLVFLGTSGDPPGDPWVRVGALDRLPAATMLDGQDILLVTAAGRPRAFAGASRRGLRFCAPARQIESAGGRVWSLTGRGRGGVASLQQHPTTVHDGVVYVDPTGRIQPPPPTDDPAEPACVSR